MISLKKLRSLSVAIFAICFISFTNVAIAKCPCKNELIYRTDAIQQSTNLVGTFALDFSAAVSETDPTTQANLVLELTGLLTAPFSITIDTGSTILTATDYNSLLAIVQGFSSATTFNSNLIGNFSVLDYTKICHGLRTVNLQALSYIIISPTQGPSELAVSLNQFNLVETSCDVFKIQSFTVTVINAFPICCFKK